LEDGDVLHIKQGGWGIFNLDASDVESTVLRVVQKLEGKLESIMKGDYEHFMLKEIFEQPESLAATMAGRVKHVCPCLYRLLACYYYKTHTEAQSSKRGDIAQTAFCNHNSVMQLHHCHMHALQLKQVMQHN
jgi:glucosamine 6-phosphate synthetase-like amidotransferase/phosphosugar isomerase protein